MLLKIAPREGAFRGNGHVYELLTAPCLKLLIWLASAENVACLTV